MWIQSQISRYTPASTEVTQAKVLAVFNAMRAERREISAEEKSEVCKDWSNRFKDKSKLRSIAAQRE